MTVRAWASGPGVGSRCDPSVSADSYWTKALARNEIGLLIQDAQAGMVSAWPSVHWRGDSGGSASPGEIDDHLFHRVAGWLIENMGQRRLVWRDMPVAQYAVEGHASLKLASCIGQGGGYINLLISDAIVRELILATAERLVRDVLGRDLHGLVAAMSTHRVDVAEIGSVVESELKVDLNRSRVSSSNDADLERFMVAWRAAQPQSSITMLPPTGSTLELCGRKLLESRHVGALLWRIAQTNLYAQDLLPALVRYRERSPDGILSAEYRTVKGVLAGSEGDGSSVGESRGGITLDARGLERAIREAGKPLSDVNSLGARILHERSAASGVSRIVELVRARQFGDTLCP